MTNGTSSWLIGIGGAIGGTVAGSLILRGLGMAVLEQRIKGLEEGQSDLKDRLSRIESILLEAHGKR